VFERRLYHHVDWGLLIAVLTLCAIGLAQIYSATGGWTGIVQTQIYGIAIGIVALLVALSIDYRSLGDKSHLIYVAILGLLLYVLLFGAVRGGSRRWIDLGSFNIQPSEFAKIAVTLALARYFSGTYRYGGIGLREILPAIGMVLAPFLLVALQPDLGSAGVFLFILAGMAVIACVRWKVLAFFGAAGAAAVPVLWFFMKEYQRQRVLTFMNPELDPLGAGYHVIQSKIAVGSGGIIGKGYLQGTQGALRFLPEQHTDFAFAVFSEEWGFLGSFLLLVLFLLLVYRLFYLTVRSQDRFASFACGGIAVFFLTHIVINMAMVCGLFPVVGIPLPFVSYGGSSMLTGMMALGAAANLSRSRFTFQGGGGKGREIAS